MPLFRVFRTAALLAIAGAMFAVPLRAQVTRADSAAVLLNVAQQLDAEGDSNLAREVLAVLLRYFGGTPAARDAEVWLNELRAVKAEGSGRIGLTVWNTVFGAWLGVAVPAAFGAEDAAPYGAGLLIGAPLGFFGTRGITAKTPVTAGQAVATSFGSIWGTFQGMGWRAVLEIGSEEQCYDYGYGLECWDSTPDEAPWTAAVVGGLAGLAGGAIIGGATKPSAGTATMVQFGALWGTWYGLALGVLANQEDDALLTWTLLGGNAGLLGTALTSPSWEVTAGQAWLISAAGWAGGVAGLGLDLLLEVEEEETAVAIPAVTSLVGLVTGIALAGRSGGRDEPGGGFGSGALINLSGSDWSIGMPLPQPTVFKTIDENNRRRTSLGARLPLLVGSF